MSFDALRVGVLCRWPGCMQSNTSSLWAALVNAQTAVNSRLLSTTIKAASPCASLSRSRTRTSRSLDRLEQLGPRNVLFLWGGGARNRLLFESARSLKAM